MRRTWLAVVCVCAVAVTITLCRPQRAWANGKEGRGTTTAPTDHQKGRGKAGKHGEPSEVARAGQHDAWMDHDHCRRVVVEYYDRRGLPPGLARKRSLPPGLQKQLRERGQLPPGLQKHLVALPVELERSLPPLPPHHVRRFAGDDLLVIDVRANLVVSVVAGVFIRR